MTLHFHQLNRFPADKVKALFGLGPFQLGRLLELVLPELARRREARLEQRSDRRRARRHNDGRPPVYPVQKVLMVLLYLRHNVSHEVVGAFFGWSADSSERALDEVLPVLRDLFPASRWEVEKQHWRKRAEGEAEWTPDEIDYAIVDSFETPIPRPSVQERQKRAYSGKKKRHTIKTQIITDQKGEILTLNANHRGPKSDLKIYQENPVPELKGKRMLGDKAYQSSVNPELETPKKKPPKGELTEEEKAENRVLSGQRVLVEHGIRRVKAWRVVRDEYRLATGLFGLVATVVVGLVQYSRFGG